MAPVFLILALVAVTNAHTPDPSDPTDDVDYPKFLEFAEKFKRQYSSAAEAHGRFLNFKSNLAKIAERNARGQEKHGVTKFADWSLEEFRKWSLGYRKNHTAAAFAQVKEFAPRDGKVQTASIDWRQKGAVTPVKNQGQCGSCWAFSATEQIETDYFLKYNDLKVLSPQQITSCDTVDLGCGGGDTVTAYQYVNQVAKGQEWNKDYPYTSGTTGETGTCKFKAADRTADLAAAYYVSQGASQESNMLKQVEQSPMSVCVDAEIWQTYESGVVTTKSGCGTQLDHCVQVAGYSAEQNYWIVRNSWATDWGNQGYIWVEAGHNVCGIAQEATIVTGSNPPSQDETITV